MGVFSNLAISESPPTEREKFISTPIEMNSGEMGQQQPINNYSTNIITHKYEYLNIPNKLKTKKQWVVHRNKVPFNVKTGREDRNNPTEWATFEEALSVVGNYDGLGFRFNNDGIVGVDIDTCINPETGEISDEATHIIKTLDSYTEISPSGYGVHIFVKADTPLPFHKKSMKPNGIVRVVNGKQKVPELEIYNSGRYFTMTGRVLGKAKPIAERSPKLQTIIDLYNIKAQQINQSANHQILNTMFNSKKGEKYKSLYGGNISDYRSHSEADQALCNVLCFFSGGDKSVIDNLFRQSGLMRPKWNEKHGADTYGNITIQKAMNSVKDYYVSQQIKNVFASPEWEQPIPFKSVDLPFFPVGELPAVISDYVRAVAETTQTATDMAATASLAILALSLQGKFEIEGKKDWREPLNLYTIVIAPPAERKSAVMAHMTEPLKRYEITENERLAPLIEQSKIDKSVLEKKKKLMEDNLAKGKLGADRSKVRELSESLSDFKEIKPCRLFCDDITPEKLASVLFDNDGRTALLSSEGGIFDMLAGRYSGGVNIDVFLKAHSGDSIRVDRQGRQSEYVQNPVMTTLLFAQPNVIESIMANGVFHGRGLCARFLYSIPTSTVGRRKFESRPISDVTANRYYTLINTLLSIQNDTPRVVTLSSRAYELLRDFANEIEPMLIDELADIADFAGKFIGATLRIAGLLYLAEYPPQVGSDLILGENFMSNAIQIGRYYLEHAKAAYQLMGADEVTEQCKYILRQLQKSQPKTLTIREIMRTCKKFKTAESVQIPISRLLDYGYLKEIQVDYSGNGRPQAKSWEVNPETYNMQI